MTQQRSYQHLVDLCVSLKPQAAWANDMSRRSGEPAIMSYLLNAMSLSLIDRPIVAANYERSHDAIALTPGAPIASENLAPGPVAVMLIRFLERRLTTTEGLWHHNLIEVAKNTFPQLSNTKIGQPVPLELSALWVPKLLSKRWLSEITLGTAPALNEPSMEMSDATPGH